MNTDTTSKRASYAIAFVLYCPEDSFLKRLDMMTERGCTVYIYDNSPYGRIGETILNKYGHVKYITSGKNVGIARALTVLGATAYAYGEQRLLFLDQDTGVSEVSLGYIGDFVQKLTSVEQDEFAAIVFSGDIRSSQSVVETTFAISSGSLFSLSILRQIGWHNESYFVDCVDYEFCLRAIHCGYKIGVVYNTPDFDHVTEQPDRKIALFGKTLLVRRYSKARIVDALTGYSRLIWYSVRIFSGTQALQVIRSMLIYLLGQFLARTTSS